MWPTGGRVRGSAARRERRNCRGFVLVVSFRGMLGRKMLPWNGGNWNEMIVQKTCFDVSMFHRKRDGTSPPNDALVCDRRSINPSESKRPSSDPYGEAANGAPFH